VDRHPDMCTSIDRIKKQYCLLIWFAGAQSNDFYTLIIAFGTQFINLKFHNVIFCFVLLSW